MANSDIHSTFFLGATAYLTNKTIIKITEENDESIWSEQWPLMKENLLATKELRDTQLELKYIEKSCSSWNSSIFVIKKKSNKWCFSTGLRRANAGGEESRWRRNRTGDHFLFYKFIERTER